MIYISYTLNYADGNRYFTYSFDIDDLHDAYNLSLDLLPNDIEDYDITACEFAIDNGRFTAISPYLDGTVSLPNNN